MQPFLSKTFLAYSLIKFINDIIFVPQMEFVVIDISLARLSLHIPNLNHAWYIILSYMK
jgi:hypothetical protein